MQRIIDQEREAFEDRVVARVRPLLQAEVDRLGKRFPDFEVVIFGMGSFGFRFDSDRNDQNNEPKAFGTLRGMCEELVEFGVGDLTPNRSV